uniref:uncharacterized protein K02A2.6-like n=1 Tax=Anopheles coluzzii TaxID=1518534 RepID=UPI0020FFDA4A|nr:uncharacterized protein K02A2.6-like [Anopheles coluzzii]
MIATEASERVLAIKSGRVDSYHRKSNEGKVKANDFNPHGQKQRNCIKCWLCGEGHHANKCTNKDRKCNRCHKFGHIQGFCASAGRWYKNRNRKRVSTVWINSLRCMNRNSVNVLLNGLSVRMMVDTGADISIISHEEWIRIGRPPLKPTKVKAKTASGDPLKLLGNFICEVEIVDQCHQCVIHVAEADLLLLGADLMDIFGLWDVPLSSICQRIANAVTDAEKLKEAYPALFADGLGKCMKTQVQLVLKEGAIPVFRPKRPVAYSMLQAVDDELQRLEREGIVTPVEYSEWALPIVVVCKANGSIRICGDYSTGLNNALMAHQYPLPLPEDIFASLQSCCVFSQIDLSDAFLQVEVDEKCRELLTVNTHRGLYRYNRLPLGIKAAPGAFQQLMDTMLAGLEGVAAYLDDIVVGGKDNADHSKNLQAVLVRLQEYSFTIRAEKFSFHKSQIKYLDHLLDGTGLRPDPDKILAITKLQPPTDVSGVRSFLGAINYYGKFVRNMRMLRQPLDDLLKEGNVFCWTQKCQHAFLQFKNILSSDLLLMHYDPRLEIIVSADASSIGFGATISHWLPDANVKVVQHASRALTATEQRYSQPEREGLAVVYAVTKFHRMLFGRHFRLQTDHQPLLRIFGSKKGIPIYTANRFQRFALTLLLYDFDIEYVETDKFGNADVLSRLINKHEKPEEDYVIASIELENDTAANLQSATNALPLAFCDIMRETQKDPVIRSLLNFIKNGWPKKEVKSPEMKCFFARREGLSTIDNCIVFGERVIVPACLRSRVLKLMHNGHPGIERMKAIARSYVYWPLIDSDIAEMVKSYKACASAAKTQPHNAPIPWPKCSAPWQRVHMDFAGPIDGLYFLLVIDAYSKWPEIISTTRITAKATVEMLRGLCSRFGMPNTIVSDNGRQFTSWEFEDFCNSNGIEHIRSPPYHPQSNGQAERFVDTFKRALSKIRKGKVSLQEAIDVFLLTYRSTPNKLLENQKTPADVMFNRRIRTTLELLRPPLRPSPSTYTSEHKPKKFNAGDPVYAKLYEVNKWRWVPGVIDEQIGSVIFKMLGVLVNVVPHHQYLIPVPTLSRPCIRLYHQTHHP